MKDGNKEEMEEEGRNKGRRSQTDGIKRRRRKQTKERGLRKEDRKEREH